MDIPTLLTSLGLGSYTSYVLAAVAAANALLIVLPVADATSGKGYNAFYGIVSWIALSVGKAAPVPVSGVPAKGLVPTPPHLK